MGTQVQEQTAPAVQAEVTQKPEVKEDLITRASKVSLEEAQPQKADSPQEAIKLNPAMIEKITDPVLKQATLEAYNSMLADYTRKTQNLASERKKVEAFEAQLNQMRNWTPERIQEELNNPSFVRAAQEYQSRVKPQTVATSSQPLTQEEFDYLPQEQQKAYLASQEAKNIATSALQTATAMKQQSDFEREDMNLKNRYANYDPSSVNKVYQDMMQGRVQATREHLWKVVDYESAVKRAYELGKQDRKVEVSEKVNASSNPNLINITPSNDVPVRIQNESSTDYFRRIALNAARKVGVVK